jgi:hypothetical protein
MDLATAVYTAVTAPIDWSLAAGPVWTAGGCILAVVVMGIVAGMQRR